MTSSPDAAKRRVVHVGTGMTGSVALRAIIDDPALELIGLKVSSPTKVGTDAGALCGRPDVGIAATDDLAAVLDAKPDCIAYCATAVRREDEVIADIVGYLEAGINVVTISAIPMVYPKAAPANWREPIEDAARRGNSTFYATGCEPGFVSLNLPTALLAGAGVIDTYRMDEYALDLDLSYPIWEVLHESMGFGKPDGHVPIRIAVGKVNNDWEPVVRYIADTLVRRRRQRGAGLGNDPRPARPRHRTRGDPEGHHLRPPLAARRDARRAPRRVGSVLRDGDLHAVARELAAPSPTRPGRHGVPHRGKPEHDPRPQSGPRTGRRHQPRRRRDRDGGRQRDTGGHRGSTRTRVRAAGRSLDRDPSDSSLT